MVGTSVSQQGPGQNRGIQGLTGVADRSMINR